MSNAINLIIIILALVSGLLMLYKIPFIDRRQKHLDINRNTKVSIVIPSYNEENRLPNLLLSLKNQDYQPHQILVVDDHSEDNTAEVAKAMGAEVITSLKLEEGWIGKSRACWSGALIATGEWIMFLDADVTFENKDSLRRLLSQFETLGKSGILSVQPYHFVKHKYESLSAVFNIIVHGGMNVFTPLGDKIKGAGAFGPCVICPKEEYFSSGGHREIRGSVMDDLELGQSFHKQGLPVKCYAGKGIISIRMYPEGLYSLIEGWTKSFGTASQYTHPGVFMMIILWISGGFSSFFMLLKAIAKGDLLWIIIGLTLYILYSVQMVWQARRFGSFYLPVLIFYPILFFFFTVIFIWSLIKTKIFRSVSWRGRKIDLE